MICSHKARDTDDFQGGKAHLGVRGDGAAKIPLTFKEIVNSRVGAGFYTRPKCYFLCS